MKTKAQVKPAARMTHRAGFTFPAKPVVQPWSNTSERTVSEPALYNAPQVGHAFGAFDIYHTATPTIQPKLTVGPVNDHYEQEADRVAQQVVGQINQPAMQRQEMPEEEEELQTKALASTVQRQEMPEEEEQLQTKPLADSIQRQETPEEEEELQTKRLANTLQRQDELEEEEVQTKPELQRRADGSMAATPALEGAIHQARGSGQALADNTRQPMERAFGADFSRVKVHTDAQADQLNRSIQARAFTTGSDIFFRQGEHSPGTRAGQELLAHELTHVVQQNGSMLQRSTPLATDRVALHSTPVAVVQRDACYVPKQDSPYAHMGQTGGVGPGEKFDPNQRYPILAENFKRSHKKFQFSKNADIQQDDITGQELIDLGTITPQIAEVDHIVPQTEGGGNHPLNAQVISLESNTSKGNQYPWGPYTGKRVYDPVQNTIYNSKSAARAGGADMTTLDANHW